MIVGMHLLTYHHGEVYLHHGFLLCFLGVLIASCARSHSGRK